MPDNVGEVSVSQASQSVLSEGGGCCPCSRGCFSLLPGPLGDVRGKMDLDSLDLQDNELDEVVSQPLPMSGEPLFEGVSEIASGGAPAGAALFSPEETSRLVKNLKAVLLMSTDSAVGGDTQRSSGDIPHEFVVPLPPRVRQRPPSVRTASRSWSRSCDERSPPLLVQPALAGLVVPVSRLALLGPVHRSSPSRTITVSFFLFFITSVAFSSFLILLLALTAISVNVNGLRDKHRWLGFLQ